MILKNRFFTISLNCWDLEKIQTRNKLVNLKKNPILPDIPLTEKPKDNKNKKDK